MKRYQSVSKTLTLLLTVAIMATLVIVAIIPVSAEIMPDTSWYVGHENETVYTISTAAQLAGWSSLAAGGNYFAGKTICLAANIEFNTGNASAWGTTAPANEWTPIKIFAGTLNGCNYKISGLYINKPDGEKLGLISELKADATIKNVAIVNSYFRVNQNSGSVAGIISTVASKSTIFKNVYSDAIMVASSTGTGVGGIVGRSDSAGNVTFDCCVFAGQISGGNQYIGGILGNGNNNPTTFTDCANYGTISAVNEVGGIMGRQGVDFTMTRCLGAGSVSSSGTGADVGSLLGMLKAPSGIPFQTVTLVSCFAETGAAPKTVVLNPGDSRGGKAVGEATLTAKTALQGEAAKQTLTGFDFNDVWTTREGAYPLPKAITDIFDGRVLEPDSSETVTTTTSASTTTAPTATTTLPVATTKAVTTTVSSNTTTTSATDKKGCGSSIAVTVFAMIPIIAGAAVIALRKNKED